MVENEINPLQNEELVVILNDCFSSIVSDLVVAEINPLQTGELVAILNDCF